MDVREESGTGPQATSDSNATDLQSGLPPRAPSTLGKRKANRLASFVWDHFTLLGPKDDPDVRCKCNYCGVDYACGTKKCGTSTLSNHLTNKCKKYPGRLVDKKQKTLSFETNKEGGGSNLTVVGRSKEECRLACAKMIVLDELPFRFVEASGFRLFCSVACPHFHPPSRRTLVRDIYQLYLDEKLKLRDIFHFHRQRVSLTTDTWTSIQNVNYMTLTAHYVDSNWMLNKRILNFCVVSNHKGETIGKMIESCLHDWGIEKIFAVTVDNASSNDTAISYLRRKVVAWGSDGCVLDGRYLHLRCCAHIINLIVGDGLREAHDSIVNIRNAIKYVKSSPARYEKLKECARKEKIDCKSILFLDVPTRWNSTYLMLETALKFEKAFDRLEEEDAQYLHYFREDEGSRRRGGPPSCLDWESASVFVKFLQNFYNVTLTFSASLQVSACAYLHEICNLVIELDEWRLSEKFFLREMATNMKKKFDKYWGQMDNVNQLLLFATILDPRYKMDYVEYCLNDLYMDGEVVSNMMKSLKANLMDIYEWYVLHESIDGSSKVSTEESASSINTYKGSSSSVRDARLSRFIEKQAKKDSVEIKNDVERYLLDARESIEKKDFEVLDWWKVNRSKYGVLSNLAKDVLAIQVSTVASESAFSTGGRILDPFRSSLSPKMVEVLVCTQNWLNASPNLDGFCMEDVEHYNQMDELLESMNSKSTEDDNGPKGGGADIA